jgi:hypothetical protein
MFLRELIGIKSSVNSPWNILGDFNLIYKDQDKRNGLLNRRLMLHFRKELNHLELKEIDLLGWCFTWSNY